MPPVPRKACALDDRKNQDEEDGTSRTHQGHEREQARWKQLDCVPFCQVGRHTYRSASPPCNVVSCSHDSGACTFVDPLPWALAKIEFVQATGQVDVAAVWLQARLKKGFCVIQPRTSNAENNHERDLLVIVIDKLI